MFLKGHDSLMTIYRGSHQQTCRSPGHVLQGVHRAVGLDASRRRASLFNRMGLSIPSDATYQARARERFAALYVGEIPVRRRTSIQSTRIIRSMRTQPGPMLRNATPIDWVR